MSVNKPYSDISELPGTIAVFPLEGALLLPKSSLPLNIFEPRYLKMADAALKAHRLIGMIQPSVRQPDGSGQPQLEAIGCAGRITQMSETGDGRYHIVLTGIARFRIVEELAEDTPYRQCRVAWQEFAGDLSPMDDASVQDRSDLLRMLSRFEEAKGMKVDWKAINEADYELIINALSMILPFGQREKQALLEAKDVKTRGEMLVAIGEMELAQQSGSPARLQ